MVAPFQRLAARLDVRTGVTVRRIEPGYVEPFGAADAVIVAVPAPIAAELVLPGTPGRPSWLDDVVYSSEVSILAYRKHSDVSAWSDVVDTDAREGVERVSLIPAGYWWTPAGWQGAGITASRSLSARLAKDASDAEIISLLFDLARKAENRLFSAEEAEVVLVARHRYAWPRWSSEHEARIAAWEQRPPIVFAGDWTWHPFVEGAVQSGEHAASVVIANLMEAHK
jgi:predicted NAD/FAD-dependent oxidoreductase